MEWSKCSAIMVISPSDSPPGVESNYDAKPRKCLGKVYHNFVDEQRVPS